MLNPATPTFGCCQFGVAAQGPCSARSRDAGSHQPGSLESRDPRAYSPHRCVATLLLSNDVYPLGQSITCVMQEYYPTDPAIAQVARRTLPSASPSGCVWPFVLSLRYIYSVSSEEPGSRIGMPLLQASPRQPCSQLLLVRGLPGQSARLRRSCARPPAEGAPVRGRITASWGYPDRPSCLQRNWVEVHFPRRWRLQGCSVHTCLVIAGSCMAHAEWHAGLACGDSPFRQGGQPLELVDHKAARSNAQA